MSVAIEGVKCGNHKLMFAKMLMQFNAQLKVILLSVTFKLPTPKTSQVGCFEVNVSNRFCIGKHKSCYTEQIFK